MAKAPAKTVIEIPPVKSNLVDLRITGKPGSTYITHRFGEMQKSMIRDKQQQKAPKTAGRKAKDPVAEYHSSIHFIHEGKPGRYGIPAISFKLAMVAACRLVEGISMAEAKQMFFVNGCNDNPELVEIFDPDGSKPSLKLTEDGWPRMREDICKTPPRTGAADLRYRAEFEQWRATLQVEYVENVISLEQLCNLLNLAGFAVGVGDWRPEKGGGHGRFEIAE